MKTMVYAMLCAVLLSLSACNTVEGLGRDMKSAGEAVTNSAQKVQSNN